MSQALYRKYRSRSLDEIVGQEHITSLLKATIDAGAVHHAYLLTGPRGVGKTSIARIIAREINGLKYNDSESHLDIIEIDAASNNGVDDVRDLRERVHIAPTSAAKKVYIIDEVHMLSKPAFNALLKTLEEPPRHVVFILATTDIDKVPATIISRVHRFNFRSITPNIVAAHLRTIASGESIDISDEALQIIAERGGGSFRDSIGMLDQVRTLGTGSTITADQVTAALGIASLAKLEAALSAVDNSDLPNLIKLLEELASEGVSATVIAEQLIAIVTGRLSQQPQLIELIDRLLTVGQSSLAQSQLLVALAKNMPSPASKPSESTPTESAQSPKAQPETKVTPKPKPKAPLTKEVTKSQAVAAPVQTVAPDRDYQHSQLTGAINDVALTSLLKKTGSTADNKTVTIYAASKFTARQLDAPAKRQQLAAALASIGYANHELEILPDKPPLNDSQSAAVAAIMGGGEEVDL